MFGNVRSAAFLYEETLQNCHSISAQIALTFFSNTYIKMLGWKLCSKIVIRLAKCTVPIHGPICYEVVDRNTSKIFYFFFATEKIDIPAFGIRWAACKKLCSAHKFKLAIKISFLELRLPFKVFPQTLSTGHASAKIKTFSQNSSQKLETFPNLGDQFEWLPKFNVEAELLAWSVLHELSMCLYIRYRKSNCIDIPVV